MSDRPNIVEFIWHDLGDWLSCYDRPDVPSPNLQRLASEGVVLENHFCPAPQCTPSRASLKTGRYPQSHGLMGLTHRGWKYADGERDLPQILGEAGYATYLFGFQHERQDPAELTYQNVWRDRSDAVGVADRTVEWFRSGDAAAAAGDRPIYASIGFGEVHRPFGTTYDEQLARTLKVPGFLPDCEGVRKDVATLYEKIRHADEQLGRVLDAIDESALAADTLVVFTTDHGPEFPRAKMTLYDPGIRVAMLMRLPGRIEAGSKMSDLTSHVDFVPTLAEAAGIELDGGVQGRSFWRRINGWEGEPREAVFAQMTWHGGEYDPMRCIRTTHHKYIRNYQPGWPVQMSGAFVQRLGEEFVERHFAVPRPAEELYDLIADPDESTNLAESLEYEPLKRELSDTLEVHLREIGDPILDGPVPVCEGVRQGYGCLWGKFPPHDPVHHSHRFRIIRDTDFKEEPL